MPSKSVDRDYLIERAGRRCEYCLTPETYLTMGLHIDHIVALQHGGGDSIDNLAAACGRCNSRKGSNIASLDPSTGILVALFNPRTQQWGDHFRMNGDRIRGRTACGRATAALLEINGEVQREIRRLLLLSGGLLQ